MPTQYTQTEIETFVTTNLSSYKIDLEDIHEKCRNNNINLTNNAGLSISEQVLIYTYSRDGYVALNKALRKGTHTPYTQTFSEMLNQTLDKLKTFSNTVYRKEEMDAQRFSQIEQKLKANQDYEVKSFYSTSKSLSAVYKAKTENKPTALFQIKSINSKDIEEYSFYNGIFGNPNEEELLFKPGSTFEIISAQNKPDPNNNYQYRITLI